MKNYPPFKDNKEMVATLQRIVELRSQDITAFNNLPQLYLQGRTATRSIPSSSTDVAATDKLYDWLQDDSYVYQLLIVSGSLRWRRIAHGSF